MTRASSSLSRTGVGRLWPCRPVTSQPCWFHTLPAATALHRKRLYAAAQPERRPSLPPLETVQRPSLNLLPIVPDGSNFITARGARIEARKQKKAASAGADTDADDASVTTMLEQTVRRDLAKYPQAILLTQVGKFFESYFEQAPLVSKLLGIKLASKAFGKKGGQKVRQPFCGFPLSQLSRHVSTLVEHGHRVVIVEEFRPTATSTTISRQVTRIVTPGTGVDEGFVDRETMNFVLALGLTPDGQIGLAYRDVSTGIAFTRQTTLKRLRDDLLLVAPREVVIDSQLVTLSQGGAILAILRAEEEREGWILSTVDVASSSSAVLSNDNAESSANQILEAYLASTLVTTPPPSVQPTRIDPVKIMQLDSATVNSLEIRESLRGGTKGSLYQAVKRTVTPGGARLLMERLCAPSRELDVIQDRLSLVEALLSDVNSREFVRALLRALEDSSRLLQRLYMRRGTASDLLGLKRMIFAANDIRALLRQDFASVSAMISLTHRLPDHSDFASAVDAAIDEDALNRRQAEADKRSEVAESLGETAADLQDEESEEADGLIGGQDDAWVIRPNFSPELASLHEELYRLRSEAFALQQRLREHYELPSLRLKTVPRIGPVVHVLTKERASKIEKDPRAVLASKSKSTRTYAYAEWSKLSSAIASLTAKIQRRENETLEGLTQQLLSQFLSMQRLSDCLDEIDVAVSFAELAQEQGLVKPMVVDSADLHIVGGRHPTVEQALSLEGRSFQSNSLEMGYPDAFVHVLTGPNMAGKSTFLRANALIVLLAQVGSYVPAQQARIGIVDRIFSRVGARDELDRSRSTFMIEMDEATSILTSATDRSLVLLDELGRGTSPLDGLAIAAASLEHLVHVNRCKTLFATHFHHLGRVIGYDEATSKGKGDWTGVEFWCTDLEISDGDTFEIRYTHGVRKGLNADSGGLIVARLAGMPSRTVDLAQRFQNEFRSIV